MRVRDADKIKTKMTVALDGQQLGYLVFGGLLAAGLVFAAGFFVGQKNAPKLHQRALAEVACLEVLDDAGAAASAVAPPAPDLRYEERLRTAAPASLPEDPALRLLAQEREDLALPGDEPMVPELPQPDANPFGTAEVDAGRVGPVVAEAKPVKSKPARKPRAAARTHQPAPGSQYTLQVQAFRSEEEAESFRSELAGRGHRPYVKSSSVPGRGRWYRVRVGSFKTRDDAVAFQQRFERSEGIDTFVSPIN